MKRVRIDLLKKICFIGSLLLVFSCTSNQRQKEDQSVNEDSINAVLNKNTVYKIPSPVELFIFMKNNGVGFKEDVLNSTQNVSKYYTEMSKAFNFGVYSSDLAYCTAFGKNQKTFDYFTTTRTLGNELGLTQTFDKTMKDRVDNNLYNIDSLFQISNDFYWQACQYMETNEKSEMLAVIISGAWLESLHLAVSSVQNFNPSDPLVQRIVEQDLLLDNILATFRKNNSAELVSLLNKFSGLKQAFETLQKNPKNESITQEQFNVIAEKVKQIRNEMIG